MVGRGHPEQIPTKPWHYRGAGAGGHQDSDPSGQPLQLSSTNNVALTRLHKAFHVSVFDRLADPQA